MGSRAGKVFREGEAVVDTDHPSWGGGVIVRIVRSGVVDGVAHHVHTVQWPNGRRRTYPQIWQTLAPERRHEQAVHRGRSGAPPRSRRQRASDVTKV